MSLLKKIIRSGIGSVFIIAAFLKLISIDEFEIYIYSFNVFSFLATTIISRLIIAGELLIGMFLIFNLYHKFTWTSTLIVECGFTLFLIFVALFRNEDNCHCFGELIELSPVDSIVKNVITIALLFLIKNDIERKHKTLLPLIFGILSIVVTFVVVPMDSVYNKIFSAEKEISTIDLYDSFDDMLKIDFTEENVSIDSTTSFATHNDKHLLVIVSSGCKYCQLGVKKLSLIVKNKNLNSKKVNIVIWGSREGIKDFREKTNTQNYSYWHIMPRRAVDITYGRFPMFIWMNNNEIVDTGDFRDIDENISL